MFMSKEWRLANATFEMFYKILKKSKTIQHAEGANNERKYELDSCYIAFNTVTRKLIMIPKDSRQQSVIIDCHYDNSDLQQYRNNVFSQLLDFADKKLTKYIEKNTMANIVTVRNLIKHSQNIKQVDPSKYNARYEVDTYTIDFDTRSGDYIITVTQKDKNKTEIKWSDVKKLSWKKFYKLLDLVKNKYEKEQSCLAAEKAKKQIANLRLMQGEHGAER